MEHDILNLDCVYMFFGSGLWDYLDSPGHFSLIKKIREEYREENRFFPILNCSKKGEKEGVNSYDIHLMVPGRKPVIITVSDFENAETFYENADKACREAVEVIADVFKDYDFAAEIRKCRQDPTVENLKRLERFYDLINPDKKLLFHYRKMLSEKNMTRAIYFLGHMYMNGEGCKTNHKQGEKVLGLLDVNYRTGHSKY